MLSLHRGTRFYTTIFYNMHKLSLLPSTRHNNFSESHVTSLHQKISYLCRGVLTVRLPSTANPIEYRTLWYPSPKNFLPPSLFSAKTIKLSSISSPSKKNPRFASVSPYCADINKIKKIKKKILSTDTPSKLRRSNKQINCILPLYHSLYLTCKQNVDYIYASLYRTALFCIVPEKTIPPPNQQTHQLIPGNTVAISGT
jgi:hypothetical protein